MSIFSRTVFLPVGSCCGITELRNYEVGRWLDRHSRPWGVAADYRYPGKAGSAGNYEVGRWLGRHSSRGELLRHYGITELRNNEVGRWLDRHSSRGELCRNTGMPVKPALPAITKWAAGRTGILARGELLRHYGITKWAAGWTGILARGELLRDAGIPGCRDTGIAGRAGS